MGDKKKATNLLLGSGLKYEGPTTASPAMLQASDAMDEIFDYSPRNLNRSAIKQGIELLREGAGARLRKLVRK